MTCLRTLIVFISLLSCICHGQPNAALPNGTFGFSFSFIELDVAPIEPTPNQPAPDHIKCWLVGEVAPDSPAAQAGIKPGDKVLYVDAQPATRLAYNYLKSLSTVDFLIQKPDLTVVAVFALHRANVNVQSKPLSTDQQQAEDGYLKIERSLGHTSTDATSLDDFLNRSFPAGRQTAAPVSAAPTTLVAPQAEPSATQVTEPSGWSNASHGAYAATLPADAPIVGAWSGGKSEHDSLHGGFVNADWTFTFAANGTYEEELYVGGQEALSAGGTYTFTAASTPGDRTITNILTFHPNATEYTNNDLARIAVAFPIPIKAVVEEYVNFFRLSDGNTMMLKDANRKGSESWQMKRR